jgi:OPA family sugar phosphate sensor protein UhpC-like MFS transporter
LRDTEKTRIPLGVLGRHILEIARLLYDPSICSSAARRVRQRSLRVNPRYERWRWQTFGITWLVYASYYLTRQSFNAAKVVLADGPLHIAREQLGRIDATYLSVYSIGQFVFGPLADRFGPRKTLLCGMGLSVLAAVGFGLSTTMVAFVLYAALQGVAQSTGWSAASKAMSSWFSLRERGRVLGWWCTHYTAGAAVATPFAGWLMETWGRVVPLGFPGYGQAFFWPAAFWGPAIVLCGVMALIWLLLRNQPEDVGLPPIEAYHGESTSQPSVDKNQPAAPSGSWELIGEVLAAPSVWLLAIAYFPIKLSRYSLYLWGPMFVKESLGTDVLTSAITSAWMPIGGMVGIIASGYISDKLFQARRAPVIILSLLATAGVMIVGLWRIEELWIMRAYFFLIGVFLYGPDSMVSATAAIDFGTKRGAGSATGFVNGVGSLGAILGGYLPGIMTSQDDWTPFLAISLAGIVLSVVILAPLWRARPPSS